MRLDHSQTEKYEPGMYVESVVNTLLDLPPSCIEFAPKSIKAPSLRECFVVGTYYLETSTDGRQDADEESGQERNGSLIAYRLQGGNLSMLQTIQTPYAVLDLHFSNFETNLFAAATSTGLLCIYSFEVDHDQAVCMRLTSSIKIADPLILVLSLSWSSSFTHQSTIAFSLSNGQIGIFDSKSPAHPVRYIQAHSLEAWTIAWSATSDMTEYPSLYSGGDDSMFCEHKEISHLTRGKTIDETMNEGLWETVSSDTKTHAAGVTAILYLTIDHSTNSEIILTGSYDEYIRVLARGVPRRRQEALVEKKLGGGIWRLKLLNSESCSVRGTYKILASCMHAGPKVLEINRSAEGIWTINTLAHFEGHESMNYASDAQKVAGDGVESMAYVSTSFYDKKLCVWKVNHG